MARGFNTAQAEFVRDNMYMPPFELMAQIIANKDQQVDQAILAANSVDDGLTANILDPDREEYNRILSDINRRKEAIIDKFQKSPLEALKDTSEVTKLAREVKNNWLNGKVFGMQKNKQAFDEFVQTNQPLIAAGKIRAEDFDLLKRFNLGRYKGINYNDDKGTFETFSPEQAAKYFDIGAFSEEFGRGYAADLRSSVKDSPSGIYMNKIGKSIEEINPEEFRKALRNAIDSNQDANSYYNQMKKIGGLTDEQIEDLKKRTITAYTDKYAYNKTSETSEKSANTALFQERAQNLAERKFAFEKEQARKAAKSGGSGGSGLNGKLTGFGGIAKPAKMASYFNNKKTLFQLRGEQYSALAQKYFKTAESNPKKILDIMAKSKNYTPQQKEAIRQQMLNINETAKKGFYEASYQPIYEAWGSDVAEGVKKSLNAFSKDSENFRKVKVNLDLNGKGYTLKKALPIQKLIDQGILKSEYGDKDTNALAGTVLPVITDLNNNYNNQILIPLRVGTPNDDKMREFFEKNNIKEGDVIDGYAKFDEIGLYGGYSPKN